MQENGIQLCISLRVELRFKLRPAFQIYQDLGWLFSGSDQAPTNHHSGLAHASRGWQLPYILAKGLGSSIYAVDSQPTKDHKTRRSHHSQTTKIKRTGRVSSAFPTLHKIF
jgi:hypothetical protein